MQQLLYVEKIVLSPLVQVVDLQVLHHQIHQEVHYEN